jgi:hypothetical protein
MTMGLLEGLDLVSTAVNPIAASACGQAGAIP